MDGFAFVIFETVNVSPDSFMIFEFSNESLGNSISAANPKWNKKIK